MMGESMGNIRDMSNNIANELDEQVESIYEPLSATSLSF